MIEVFCTQAYLLFRGKNSFVLTDFELNVFRKWELNSPIQQTYLQNSIKRKESILVSLENGDLLRINLDNSFPITLLEYKVQITFFQFNRDMSMMLLIDVNKNLVVFKYDAETLELKQLF